VEVGAAEPEAEETKVSTETEDAKESANEEEKVSNEVTASSSESSDTVAEEAEKPTEVASDESEATKATDTPNLSEKSSFENEPEKEAEVEMDSTLATTVAATAENSEEEQVSKYMLLDRLFKFLDSTGDEPVNDVLAGYFSKVVQLLINRKQKQIVPYITADENKCVEGLLKHVYSRSVAEIVLRLLQIVESNFDEDISAKIFEKKQFILTSLIDKLQCEEEDETVMNVKYILQEMME